MTTSGEEYRSSADLLATRFGEWRFTADHAGTKAAPPPKEPNEQRRRDQRDRETAADA